MQSYTPGVRESLLLKNTQSIVRFVKKASIDNKVMKVGNISRIEFCRPLHNLAITFSFKIEIFMFT